MALYTRNGSAWRPHRERSLDLQNVLPGGNYIVKIDPEENLFLDEISPFELPPRLYGDTTRYTKRVVSTFQDRAQSTGVLLVGEKGSGKTLLAKSVCATLAAQGVPTIVINSPLSGDKFNSFIQAIEQPAVIFFDEFEKTYRKMEEQEELLTLLDGTYPTKKLFILTCNDQHRVDHHLRNRPGRIFYFLTFNGLEENFVREYCLDNLAAPTHTEDVVRASRMFSQFNFDMLKALVEDMNRYNETPEQVLAILNARPDADDAGRYLIRVKHEGQEYSGKQVGRTFHYGNPLSENRIEIDIYVNPEERYQSTELYFFVDDFVRIDRDTGAYVFVNAAGDELILTNVKDRPRNFFAA